MHFSTLVNILLQYTVHAIALAVALLVFAAGFVIGRIRMKWELQEEMIALRDQAEWERARSAQLGRELETARLSAADTSREALQEDRPAVGVMRREIDRLREELRSAWEGQSKAQKRAQELESRISVLVSRPTRHASSAVAGEPRQTSAIDDPSRGRATGGEKVLTLWPPDNHRASQAAGNRSGERDQSAAQTGEPEPESE